ncbi:MAG: hypothetical protein ACT4PV_04340 [Planctomycetaceae bacterium]
MALLVDAGGAGGREGVPTVVADQGVENRNGEVDARIASGALHRVLAMSEIRFSNSRIEAWWKRFQQQRLRLHPLDRVAKLRPLVAFSGPVSHVGGHDYACAAVSRAARHPCRLSRKTKC